MTLLKTFFTIFLLFLGCFGWIFRAEKINAIMVASPIKWQLDGVTINNYQGHQGDARIVGLLAKKAGAIVVWTDYQRGNIYGQRVDVDGALQWQWDGVSLTEAPGLQNDPAAVLSRNNSVIVSWTDEREGTSNRNIYAQEINKDGIKRWTNGGVLISGASGIQQLSQIVSDDSGGAIITWEDERNGGYDANIYAQRVNRQGIVQWLADGVGIATLSGSQKRVAITSDGSGGAILVWGDFRTSGNWGDIYGQKIDKLGNILWSENGIPVATGISAQENAQVVSDSLGGAIITWTDNRLGSEDIYAQRVSSSGDVLWGEDGIAITNWAGDQNSAQIIPDNSGGAVIVWQDKRSADYDIYGQRVDMNGTKMWSLEGVEVVKINGDQVSPKLVLDSVPEVVSNADHPRFRGFAITWMDYRSGPSDRNIYIQKMNENGFPLWTLNGELLCGSSGNQDYPFITSDSNRGFIATWTDYRNGLGDANIYAQRAQ